MNFQDIFLKNTFSKFLPQKDGFPKLLCQKQHFQNIISNKYILEIAP